MSKTCSVEKKIYGKKNTRIPLSKTGFTLKILLSEAIIVHLVFPENIEVI